MALPGDIEMLQYQLAEAKKEIKKLQDLLVGMDQALDQAQGIPTYSDNIGYIPVNGRMIPFYMKNWSVSVENAVVDPIGLHPVGMYRYWDRRVTIEGTMIELQSAAKEYLATHPSTKRRLDKSPRSW